MTVPTGHTPTESPTNPKTACHSLMWYPKLSVATEAGIEYAR